ncbi:MAG TPA: hypothetical protein VFW34_02695 [Candidatus Rubrimentiphilum sp.]|nr:hypothetical protein [Candidatus Rubrimentiphilum sp.]
MRTVCAVTTALLALAPMTARAATDPYTAMARVREAFSHVQSVQLVEKFPSGAVATVQFSPSAPARVATVGVSKYQLLLDYATQPAGALSSDLSDQFAVASLGHKSLYGMPVDGYRLIDQAGAVETIWVNAKALPVAMHVEAYGESMDVLYGDYNNPTFFATRP